MKHQNSTKWVLGMLFFGYVFAGCVAVVRKGYKYYESETHITITMDMNIPARDVYNNTIATIEKKGITKITKRDDKKMTLEVDKKGQKGEVTVVDKGANKSQLNLTAEKLKNVDVKTQKQELEQSLLAVCSQLKIECNPASEKK